MEDDGKMVKNRKIGKSRNWVMMRDFLNKREKIENIKMEMVSTLFMEGITRENQI